MLAGLLPLGDPLHARARPIIPLTPWATAFRYPADDPATAPAPPSREEIERRLGEVEALIAAVADRAARLRPGNTSEPES